MLDEVLVVVVVVLRIGPFVCVYYCKENREDGDRQKFWFVGNDTSWTVGRVPSFTLLTLGGREMWTRRCCEWDFGWDSVGLT
jgi:hypothetical protein